MRLGPIILEDIQILALETIPGGDQIPLEIVAGPTTLDIQIQALETPHGAQMERFITIQTAQAH